MYKSELAESNCSLVQFDVEVAELEIPKDIDAESNESKENTISKSREEILKNSRLTKHLIDGSPHDISDESDTRDFGIEGENAVGLKKKYSFSPTIPANSPVVLTWQNLSVTTTTASPKVLLDNISGTITGGFWAIMGASGGGMNFSISIFFLYFEVFS